MNRRAFLATLGTLAGAGCSTRRGTDARTGGPTTVATTPTAETTTEQTGGATRTTARSDGSAVPDSVDAAWPMPAHDSGLSNYTAEAAGPTTPPTELWSVSFETSLSDLAVADGTVYVGGNDGAVRALDARTGAEQWREVVGPSAATPRVVDGRLYVPTPGAVVVLEAGGGGSVERVETPGRSDLLVASHGVYSVGADGPALVARGLDGDRRWRADLGTPWQSPLFASDDHVFVSTGTHWEEPWTFAVDTGRFAGDRRPDGRGNDMIAERFALDGTVFAVDPMFGEVESAVLDYGGYDRRWSAHLDAYSPVTLAGGADHLYVAAEHPEPELYALSLTDGTTEGRCPSRATSRAVPSWRGRRCWCKPAGNSTVSTPKTGVVGGAGRPPTSVHELPSPTTWCTRPTTGRCGRCAGRERDDDRAPKTYPGTVRSRGPMRSARALPLLVAVLLLTSGCLGLFGPDRPPSDERAVEAIDASRSATAAVDGYRFALRGRVESEDARSVSVAGAGRVDVRDRRLNATTRAEDATRGVYLDNHTRYTECARIGWGRQNLSASTSTPWLDHTPIGRQLALLEATSVYWNGTGDGSVVVTARPTGAELRADGDRGVGGAAFGGGNVRDVTTRARFDAETHRLQRVRHRIRVARGGETATATVTLRFDYGPVEVTRPGFDPDAVWQTGCPGS